MWTDNQEKQQCVREWGYICRQKPPPPVKATWPGVTFNRPGKALIFPECALQWMAKKPGAAFWPIISRGGGEVSVKLAAFGARTQTDPGQ